MLISLRIHERVYTWNRERYSERVCLRFYRVSVSVNTIEFRLSQNLRMDEYESVKTRPLSYRIERVFHRDISLGIGLYDDCIVPVTYSDQTPGPRRQTEKIPEKTALKTLGNNARSVLFGSTPRSLTPEKVHNVFTTTPGQAWYAWYGMVYLARYAYANDLIRLLFFI